jgi:hypothetical protein
MIQPLVDRFMANKLTIESTFRAKHPENYAEIVKTVVSAVTDDDSELDPDRIHELNDGDYQGTLVYVIGAKGYHPYDYWYVKVIYGSCSVCDTLESIRSYSYELPSDEQVADYMTLALHIVQSIRKMND